MADQPTGQNETPEKETQEAAVPTAEQQTPKPKVEQPVPQEKAAQQTDGQELPEDASERTRREFDKLRDQLKDERTRRQYYESVMNTLTPQQPQQPSQIIDPETGLLNEQALTETQKTALEARERAARAEQALQSYQNDQENREVYREYPELDPTGGKHDKELHNETRRLMLDSMVNPDDYGKQLSFIDAANLAKEKLGTQATKEGAKEAIDQLAPKEQASLEAHGSSQRAREDIASAEEDTLRYKARRGDDHAMAELLARKRVKSSGE